MTRLDRTPAWRRYLNFWGQNLRDDVEAELQFHVDMRAAEYAARGMCDADARQAALARMGSLETPRDECIEIGRLEHQRRRRARLADSIAIDIRYALRSFARSPVWAAVAVTTIALGIGANAAVFSVVDRLLVRPLGYPDANRVMVAWRDIHFSDNNLYSTPTPQQTAAWRSGARSVDAVEEFGRSELTLSSPDSSSDPLAAVAVDSGFFAFANVHPRIGHVFPADDAAAGRPTSIMLAESYWRSRFGASPDVLGRVLHTRDGLLTIVGVVPATARLPDIGGPPPSVWLPLRPDQRRAAVLVRLRPRVSPDAARAELDRVIVRAGVDMPYPGAKSSTRLVRPGDTIAFRRELVLLGTAVALLLLVACANVAHLLLARGAARERELAVRHALGAGRARLVLQIMCESFVLAVVGGLFAALVAIILLHVTSAVRPSSLPELAQLSSGANVVTIAGALTLAAGAAVGLLAGLRSARRDLGSALRIGQGSSRSNAALRSSLVVSEIAVSATLLVGALLLIRSVATLQRTPLGFEPRDLYGATFNLRATRWSAAERFSFAQDLARRAFTMPGVASATVAATVPPNGPFVVGVLETPEHPAVADAASFIGTNAVASEYFSRLGIAFAAGRTFDASPDPNDVILNEALATRLWRGESPVGRRFRVASAGPGDNAGPWWTVVGVTRNSVVNGLTRGTSEVMYTPLTAATEDGRITLIVRSRRGVDPTPALRHVGSEIRPDTPTPTITDVPAALDASMAEPRFAMQVLTAFAILAVIMAAIGLYGVISYTVSRRTREIGIRMTLGATRTRIARLVVGNGLRLAAAGVVVGLAGAWATASLLEHSLYGVRPHDAWSFAIGGATLVLVSLAACLIPMTRATAVDPVVAVRAD